MDVLRHDDPGPQVETFLTPGLLKCLDEPPARPVLAEQRQAVITGKGQKMGFPRIIIMFHCFSIVIRWSHAQIMDTCLGGNKSILPRSGFLVPLLGRRSATSPPSEDLR